MPWSCPPLLMEGTLTQADTPVATGLWSLATKVSVLTPSSPAGCVVLCCVVLCPAGHPECSSRREHGRHHASTPQPHRQGAPAAHTRTSTPPGASRAVACCPSRIQGAASTRAACSSSTSSSAACHHWHLLAPLHHLDQEEAPVAEQLRSAALLSPCVIAGRPVPGACRAV